MTEHVTAGAPKTTRLLPKKRDFRQRAHCNPLSDSYLVYPPSPDFVDWSVHFPALFGRSDSPPLALNTIDWPVRYPDRVDDKLNGRAGPRVDFVDVGCGYGGLSVALATEFPNKLTMGMEIREKVTNYVGERIRGLRLEHPGKFQNVSVIRTNVMKFLVNYFRKAQLEKMFFCFPDPHFKKSNERRRIIGPSLLSLYAYVLKEGGRIYAITDVEELHLWMRTSMLEHPLFKELVIDEACRAADPCIRLIEETTEEGKKATRLGKKFYSCVFERVSTEDAFQRAP